MKVSASQSDVAGLCLDRRLGFGLRSSEGFHTQTGHKALIEATEAIADPVGLWACLLTTVLTIKRVVRRRGSRGATGGFHS